MRRSAVPFAVTHVGSGVSSQSASACKAVSVGRGCAADESNLALALRLSQQTAENETDAAADLAWALKASLASSQEERDLLRALELSGACAGHSSVVDASANSASAGTEEHGKPYMCSTEAGSTRPADFEAVSTVDSQHVLKVCMEGDTRRIRVAWPVGATPNAVLVAITAAVRHGFNLPLVTADIAVKYRDDEGDLCTLAEPTLHDFLDLSRGGPLRLFAVLQGQQEEEVEATPAPETSAALPAVSGLAEFSIATPPASPRPGLGGAAAAAAMEEEPEEELAWTLVESPAA